MGKTLSRIISVGAAIAVNVIPELRVLGHIPNLIKTAITVHGIQSGMGLLGLGPSMQKPEPTESAIKTPRPPRVSAYGRSRLYGAYAIFETSGDGTAVDVFAVHDGRIDGIEQHYLNDDKVSLLGSTVAPMADGRYGENSINLYTTDGSDPGAGIPALSALLPGIWTPNHRGDGVSLLAMTAASVKAEDFLEVYPNHAPVASIVARWQRCPDPRAANPANPAGWTWTENPVRHLLHYLLMREGVDYVTRIAPAIAYWRRAADVCDGARPLKGGGSEPRYRSNLAHKHTDSHGAVKGSLLATFDGWMAPRQDGALVIHAGEYYTPTVAIGPDDIVAYEWEGVGVDDDSAVNEIRVSYVSADHDYNSVETDPWTDEADISRRGSLLSDSLELQIPSHAQGRALAKRVMARANAPWRGTVTTGPSGRAVRGERYIHLTLVEAGAVWFDGPAEIVSLTRNLSTGGVTFAWVAADPNIDNWNPVTEEGDPAPVGNRIAPQPLDAPEIVNISVEADTTAMVTIDATGPDRTDLTWQVRWRQSGFSAWNEQQTTDMDPLTPVVLVLGPLPINIEADVQIAYTVGDGRLSPWSNLETVDTSPPVA